LTNDRRSADKVAIVTAGGGGIGRAVARRLARTGAAVLIGDKSLAHAADAAREIEAEGGCAHAVEMDLGRPEDAIGIVDRAVEICGRLDILVNCAAILGALKPFIDLTLDEWEQVIRTNVNGTFLVTQAAVRRVLAQGEGGAIVNMLAIQALMPLPDHAPYAASKGALSSFTRSLAVELAGRNIRVNGIAVGSIYTPGVKDELNQMDPDEADRSAATLVGRMGRPEDIADLAVFLASDEARYLAGAIIPADGGRLLSRKPDPFLLALQKRKSPPTD
jgi:NAD(P)-dependent dehydrogenase (short-subunit alcohol dehydrogenase family)